MKPWELPFATPSLEGTGGVVREDLEDFLVEELPLYEPSGSGEHVYLKLEKRGLSTFEAVRRITRALGLSERVAGYAGLKDARAVTIQTVSLSGVDPEHVLGLDLRGIRVLEVNRHRNKLKKGHLRGNRFRIRIRDVAPGSADRADRILEQLQRNGVPNGFGPQRFGLFGNSHLLGRALLQHDGRSFYRELLEGGGQAPGRAACASLLSGDARRALSQLPPGQALERRAVEQVMRCDGSLDLACQHIDRSLRTLYLAAAQAELFNAVLRRRFDDYNRLLQGDLAWLHRNGAVYLVLDLEAEERRCARFEVSPSGPLFGRRTTAPAGQPLMIENKVLERCGLDARLFRDGMPLQGARRPLRVPVESEPSLTDSDGSLWVSFSLPKGAYATLVLREVMKT